LEQILFQKSLLKSKKTKGFQMAAAQAMARIGTKEAHAALQRVAREGSGDLQTRCKELIQSSGREHDSTNQQ
jgi:hypothetical protein